MKIKMALLGLLLLASSSGTIAFAEQATPSASRQARFDAWKSMSPEARQAQRAEWRQKFQNMSPEERKAFRAKRQARFQSLPPEKQQAIHTRMQQRHARRRPNGGSGNPTPQ